MSAKELNLAHKLTLSILQHSDNGGSTTPIKDMLLDSGEKLVYELYRPDVDLANILELAKQDVQKRANEYLSSETIKMLHFADDVEGSKLPVDYGTIFNIVGEGGEFVHPIITFLTNPTNDNYKKCEDSAGVSDAKITVLSSFSEKAQAYDYCQKEVSNDPRIQEELANLYKVFPTFGGARNLLCPSSTPSPTN